MALLLPAVAAAQPSGDPAMNGHVKVGQHVVVTGRDASLSDVLTNTDYRKIQNTIEGDYQFNRRYSIHFGYRYAARRVEEAISGFSLGANAPPASTPSCTTW